MADYIAKKGDSLTDLQARLKDRDGLPMDLTTATGVEMYMRPYGSTINKLTNTACTILAPRTDGRIQGPADATALDTAGDFRAYFKVDYPGLSRRVPSDGYLWIEVEDNFE